MHMAQSVADLRKVLPHDALLEGLLLFGGLAHLALEVAGRGPLEDDDEFVAFY